jgi:hypothetical protein
LDARASSNYLIKIIIDWLCNNIFASQSFLQNDLPTTVILTKSFMQAILFGTLAGILLALVNLSWFIAANPTLLPLLVACWWLVIFGINLWHAYLLGNQRLKSTPRFMMQVSVAGIASMVYFGIQRVFIQADVDPIIADTAQLRLQASLASELDVLISNPSVIVPAAFVLSLATSGLLYSILSRPSAK